MKKGQCNPEDTCQKCGGYNVTWYANNEVFNNINGSPNGIMCPACFEKMAKNKGLTIIFRAEQIVTTKSK